ncbi:ABC transporter permease [Paenibacillus sp. NPDC058071]|uniref:ABC transporter permease n=1 Tax=Paenibacillus sp. NPDC058071 TaxID=3346326 RepID=UPI0036D7943B
MKKPSVMLRDTKRKLNGWIVISGIGAIAALLPSLYILTGLFRKPNENWAHIQTYLLADYAKETLILVACTVFFTVMIGAILAWLVAAYEFPFRRFFAWGLALPLSIPPYIAAYTYGSMFSYTGSVQRFFRNTLGMQVDQRYFDILSMKGAIFIFTLFLYPYVYLVTKTFLERQSAAFIENARLLGKGPITIFFRIVLPLSQAAIVGGASLVAFEVLNDFGLTKHFGIQSFTAAIFKTWFGMNDIDSANRLAALLMSLMILLLVVERLLRRRKSYSSPTGRSAPLQRRKLKGAGAGAAFTICLVVFSLSFLIPVIQLAVWASWTYDDVINSSFWVLIRNTIGISLLAVLLLIIFACIAANASRFDRSIWSLAMTKMIGMGYSIPGAVLSIGVLAIFISTDERLASFYKLLGYAEGKLVLTMSLVMLVFAYIVRFAAVGFNAVETGFEKRGIRYAEASRMLGRGLTRTFFTVDLPMIKGAVLTGFLLAFMEIVKELPLTLLLRPFNFDTLATKAYQYASDEQIHQASVPALILVAIGVVSVLIYHRIGERQSA